MKKRASASLRYQATRQDQFHSLTGAGACQLRPASRVGSGGAAPCNTHTLPPGRALARMGAFWSTMPTGARTCRTCAHRLGLSSFLPADTNELGRDCFLPDDFSFLRNRTHNTLRTGLHARTAPLCQHPHLAQSAGPNYGVRLGIGGQPVGC